MPFVKGQAKPKGSGRKKGQLNKTTLAFKEAVASVGPFEGDSVASMTMIYKHKDLPLGVRMQAANSILLFIPFDGRYTASINDTKGRRVLLFHGMGKNWIEAPIPSLSQGMYLLYITNSEGSAFSTFQFVR